MGGESAYNIQYECVYVCILIYKYLHVGIFN